MKSPLRFSPCVNPEEKSNVIFKKRVYVKFSLENLLKLKKLYEKVTFFIYLNSKLL